MLEVTLSGLAIFMIWRGFKSVQAFDKTAERNDLVDERLKEEACHLVDEYVYQIKDPGDIHTAMRRRHELEEAMLQNHADRINQEENRRKDK